jgi:hypothetical protein
MIAKRLSVLFDKTFERVKKDAENYGKGEVTAKVE